MTLLTIIIGIFGMGIVVFFHELGHFFVARLLGVGVEEFSIGWGPKIFSKKVNNIIYSISALPIGGFCRMSGEESYKKAIDDGLEEFPKEKGTFYGEAPWKRILIAFGGPFMNIILAFILYIVISGIGYDTKTWGNTIVLASQYDNKTYAADKVGLATGDKIIAINGKKISTYAEIQEKISLSAKKPSIVSVERNGKTLDIKITPELDKESGAGKLGIYPFIEPIVYSVLDNSPAKLAGIKSGDKIISFNNIELKHALELDMGISSLRLEKTEISFVRDGNLLKENIVIPWKDGNPESLGISWKPIESKVQAKNIINAISMGFTETCSSISATYKGLASLFMGTNILKAVSGPARITWMIGSVATSSFSLGADNGFSMVFNLLAFLSIALFSMNLLPIPLLDGGSIVLYLIEMIRGKAAKIKTVLRYQTIGMVVVALLFVLATMSDFLFFTKK